MSHLLCTWECTNYPRDGHSVRQCKNVPSTLDMRMHSNGGTVYIGTFRLTVTKVYVVHIKIYRINIMMQVCGVIASALTNEIPYRREGKAKSMAILGVHIDCMYGNSVNAG